MNLCRQLTNESKLSMIKVLLGSGMPTMWSTMRPWLKRCCNINLPCISRINHW
jgi:hypothetical protein